jgi:N-acylglucosamine 2-epimerase|uniref:AGE family epimerase/isomerase n=1 Tax=Daejeonella sp. TaxID=2805397 RepID=UPI00404B1075
MKRRQFMSNTILAGLGSLSLNAYGSDQAIDPEKIKDFESGNLDLKKLYDFYHFELFDSFIPNMDKYVIDHQLGGFMTSVDITNGTQVNSNKTAWFEGRGMWTYSFLYNHFGKNSKYLEGARKSKDFILKLQPKDNSFWTSSFDRMGNPLSGPGDIYSSLFVAEGLAEFAKASGEKQYFTIAKKIILSCLDRYDSPDYNYYVAYLNPGATKIPGPRVLGHWMVFLRAATQILENGPDADMEKLADRCLDACLNHHLNPHYQLFNEVLNHDFSRPDNSYKDFAYTGHGIEMCWMLHFEAVRRKDKKLFDRITEVFKRHVTVAHDDVYGGYFRALDHVDNNTWKVDKVLWLQEEVLIGSMFIAEHTGEQWAKKLFNETLEYVRKSFVKPGNLFWASAGDRFLKDYAKMRAEHYHHPRHLMLNLLSLKRMIKRNGKPSGLFD